MKIEKLRKNNSKKYFLCGLISVAVLTITITFITSKANYRMTASIPLTEGKVVSSPYDLNIVAMYIDGVEQSKETTMPGKGYVLTSDSYCYKGSDKSNKDNNVILETNKYGEHIISELSKSSKCILYFKRREATTSAASYILSHITEMTHRKRGTFNQVIEGETTGKIYADSDDDGVTYYYAGNPTDNWVEFGGYYWRIIRVNGNGSIRMIYQGRTEDDNGNKLEPQATGEETQIGESAFNEQTGDNAYIGYMYGTPNSDTHEATHENKNDSTIKQYLDNWFASSNIKQGTSYFNFIDLDAGFCGDRTSSSTVTPVTTSPYNIGNGFGGTGKAETYYGAFLRLRQGESGPTATLIAVTPTFSCPNNNDLYTYSGANHGNKKLTNPVGLITADEAAYGGLVVVMEAQDNYLRTGVHYTTMSPYVFGPVMSFIHEGGWLSASGNGVLFSSGVRPVISLRSDVTLTGDGTISNPYKVN
ncbi:MAG: hypothetical protein NC483_06905 [Ruminococcus sp.]|nr:hypothetical protein [Ruminococcus sp.]